MSLENQVQSFLNDVKKRIEMRQYDFIYDDMVRLSELGISITEAIMIVKNLRVEDCFRGPSRDHLYPTQQIFEFGKKVDDFELYIKLTIRQKDDVFIMSFHKTDRPIKYRFNKKGR